MLLLPFEIFSHNPKGNQHVLHFASNRALQPEEPILDPERQEERVALFERYASLGLCDMKRYCYDERPSDPLLGILGLLDSIGQSSDENLPGLDAAAKQLGEFF
jgi:hypothetical protein